MREAQVNDSDRRKTGAASDDGFSAAFEMIVTPVIFGLLGFFIDSRVGTYPVFTLILAFVVLSYEVWRVWTRYSDDMDAELEARRSGYGRGATS